MRTSRRSKMSIVEEAFMGKINKIFLILPIVLAALIAFGILTS